MASVFNTTGKAITSLRVIASALYAAIGSGAGTAAVGDTTLFTEYTTGTWTGYARVSAALSQVTTTLTNDTVQSTATFTAPAGGATVTNAGLFDALTVGNLLQKADFTGIVLGASDSVALTFKLTYS